MAKAPKFADIAAVPEHAAPAPVADLTFFRGTAIESMNEADLRASLREVLGTLRGIGGLQSDRQRRALMERLGL